jgi:outer membrane protein TolC
MHAHSQQQRLGLRRVFLLTACLAACGGLIGCTSVSDYIRNGFKVGPNYGKPPVYVAPEWIEMTPQHIQQRQDQVDNVKAWANRLQTNARMSVEAAEKHLQDAMKKKDKAAVTNAEAAVKLAKKEEQEVRDRVSEVLNFQERVAERPRSGDANIAAWWCVFGDDVLNRLVQSAYSQNLTVRQAGWRILEARAQKQIAIGEIMPQTQNWNFTYQRNMLSLVRLAFIPKRYFDLFQSNGNLAWELDFWGKFRRAIESADAALDASVEDYDDVLVILLSDTARAYVEYRTLQRRLELAQLNVVEQEEMVEVMRARMNAGTENSFPDFHQLNANLENTRSLVPQLEALLRLANNKLCVLLGLPTRDLSDDLPVRRAPSHYATKELKDAIAVLEKQFGKVTPGLEANLAKWEARAKADRTLPAQIQNILAVEANKRTETQKTELIRYFQIEQLKALNIVVIPRPKREDIVLNIPAELLLRRPDVQRAERQLAAQSAQIGVAESALYPHISLTGSVGVAASQFGKLFNSLAWFGSFGPSLTWDILNYGRILANVRYQDAKFQEQAAFYQNTILNANKEAEDALIAYLQAIVRAKELFESADSAVKAVRYFDVQKGVGVGKDYGAFINRMFTLTNFKTQQQDAAAQAEGDIALNLILLYRALGGGWQIRLGANCDDDGEAHPVENRKMAVAADNMPVYMGPPIVDQQPARFPATVDGPKLLPPATPSAESPRSEVKPVEPPPAASNPNISRRLPRKELPEAAEERLIPAAFPLPPRPFQIKAGSISVRPRPIITETPAPATQTIVPVTQEPPLSVQADPPLARLPLGPPTNDAPNR